MPTTHTVHLGMQNAFDWLLVTLMNGCWHQHPAHTYRVNNLIQRQPHGRGRAWVRSCQLGGSREGLESGTLQGGAI